MQYYKVAIKMYVYVWVCVFTRISYKYQKILCKFNILLT